MAFASGVTHAETSTTAAEMAVTVTVARACSVFVDRDPMPSVSVRVACTREPVNRVRITSQQTIENVRVITVNF
jgi:hypothetical protein